MSQPTTAAFASRPCKCVKHHSPKVNRTQLHHIHPLGMGGPDVKTNIVALCPTTHSEVHLLIEHFVRVGGIVTKRRGWGDYAYDLAVKGYHQATHPQEDA